MVQKEFDKRYHAELKVLINQDWNAAVFFQAYAGHHMPLINDYHLRLWE